MFARSDGEGRNNSNRRNNNNDKPNSSHDSSQGWGSRRVERWYSASLSARKCDRKWFPLWLTSGLLIMQGGSLKPANSPEGPPLLQVFVPEPSQWILPPAATLTDPEAEGGCVSFHHSFVLVLGSVPSPNLPL